MIDIDLTSIVNKQEKFEFGKYKNKFIMNICITDPAYICWLGNDEARYRLTDDWRKLCEESAEEHKDIRYASYCKR